jgi:hypothetical protein
MGDDADDAWEEYYTFRARHAPFASPSRQTRTLDSSVSPQREILFPLDPFYYGNAAPPAFECDRRKVELCIPPLVLGNLNGHTRESTKAHTTAVPSVVESEASSNGSDSDLQFEDYCQGEPGRFVHVHGQHADQRADHGPSCYGSRFYPGSPNRNTNNTSGAAERMSTNWSLVRGGEEGSRSNCVRTIGHPGHLRDVAQDPYHEFPLRPIHQYPQVNADCQSLRTPSNSILLHHNANRNSHGSIESPKIIEISPGAEVVLRGADEVSLRLFTGSVV